MAVVPITIDIPMWNLRFIRNHVPTFSVETTADIGSGSTLTQYVANQAVSAITITINGGVLPSDDMYILINSDQGGVIFPGVGEFQWTADRVSVPNRILLNTVPITPINLAITLSV